MGKQLLNTNVQSVVQHGIG